MVLLCLGVACLSLVVAQLRIGSPEQLAKGIRQIIGISFTTLLFFSVRRYIRNPSELAQVSVWLWRGCLILALFGIWQFIAQNLLGTTFLADWQWVDSLLGHSYKWGGREFDSLGGLYRAKSLSSEPAQYCQTLILAMGFVIFRLLPPGTILKKMRGWEIYPRSIILAIIYLLSFILSISLVGYFGLMIILLGHLVLFRMLTFKKIIVLTLIGLIFMAGLLFVTKKIIYDKLATMAMILPGEEKELQTEAFSSLVLAVHFEVANKNLLASPLWGCGIGGHGTTVNTYLPPWAHMHPALERLNLEDANSLALRLLSEMGLVGFLVFSLTFAVIIRRAWKAIRAACAAPIPPKILPLCAGLMLAATAEVIVFMARMGSYFNLYFWFILALTAAIPEVLNSAAATNAQSEK
ncbi:MAG: O-antigen ligase family protein [Desulfobaccales bacterium]